MTRFSEMTASSARKIDRLVHNLSDAESLDELETRFMARSESVVPVDCACWNNFQPGTAVPISLRVNQGYEGALARVLGALPDVLGHHPVIAAGQLSLATQQVVRVSDFQSYAQFKENPIYRQVYRHVDCNFQIAYTPCILSDRQVSLTWGKRNRDYTEADRQTFHYFGQRFAGLLRSVEERQRLQASWLGLGQFISARTTVAALTQLKARDIAVLTALLRMKSRNDIARLGGVRRDSVDRQLGGIRERLGLENHNQLLSALAELAPPAVRLPISAAK